MYIIQHKETQQLLYMNAAIMHAVKEPAVLFPGYNPQVMETGWNTEGQLPTQPYTIDASGQIKLLSLEEQVAQGLLELAPSQKLEDGKIVPKTAADLIADDGQALAETEKVIAGEVVEMSLEEQVVEGVLELEDYQKVENGELVDKTMEEMYAEGLVELEEPFQYISDNGIYTRTVPECLEENLFTTAEQVTEGLMRLRKAHDTNMAQYSLQEQQTLTREYMEATLEGKKGTDARIKAYQAMKKVLAPAEKEFQEHKTQLETLLKKLSK